jgi:hypothetical protein
MLSQRLIPAALLEFVSVITLFRSAFCQPELWFTLSFGSGSPSDHHPVLTILVQDSRPDHCPTEMGQSKELHYAVEPLKRMDKHDFSYVLFSAALGALGVFLIAGLALEDQVLLIFSGLCLGLALIASIVYMIHLARGPRYEPRLNENGDIISIWCLNCMKSNDPTRSRCKGCGRPIK